MNGKLCTCDRCGAQVFLKTTGDGVTDGGWTRWNKFEPYPEGWKVYYDVGRLCPTCNEEFQRLLADFLRKPNN